MSIKYPKYTIHTIDYTPSKYYTLGSTNYTKGDVTVDTDKLYLSGTYTGGSTEVYNSIILGTYTDEDMLTESTDTTSPIVLNNSNLFLPNVDASNLKHIYCYATPKSIGGMMTLSTDFDNNIINIAVGEESTAINLNNTDSMSFIGYNYSIYLDKIEISRWVATVDNIQDLDSVLTDTDNYVYWVRDFINDAIYIVDKDEVKPKNKLRMHVYSKSTHHTADVKNIKVKDDNYLVSGVEITKTALNLPTEKDENVIADFVGDSTLSYIKGVTYKIDSTSFKSISDLQFSKDIVDCNITVGGMRAESELKNRSILNILDTMLHKEDDTVTLTISDFKKDYPAGTSITSLTIPISVTTKSSKLTKCEVYINDSLFKTETLSGESYSGDITLDFTTAKSSDFKLTLTAYNQNKTTDTKEETVTFGAAYYGTDNSSLYRTHIASFPITLNFNSTDLATPILKYPASLGDLTKITDASGTDDYTASFTKTTETINDMTYNVYTKIVASIHNNFSYKFSQE